MLKLLIISIVLPLSSCASNTAPTSKNEPVPAKVTTIASTDPKKNIEVVLYTSKMCGYCQKAKEILHERQVNFKEVYVDGDDKLMAEMKTKTGKETVPQIMINGEHFGSYKELKFGEIFGGLDEKFKKK